MKTILLTIVAIAASTLDTSAHPLTNAQISNATFDRYINANSILMIVSNDGLYATDRSGLFGYYVGMFYPYTSVGSILDGSEVASPLYSAGLWLGGKVGGETRVTVAEFASEFWPGPMVAGTFLPYADTAAEFRVYQLYCDSLEDNPNIDYLDWPSAYGAAVDSFGKPILRGEQTLWSVFNDANPTTHIVNAGASAPLGIEVGQTTWASSAPGYERIIFLQYELYNKGNETITDMYLGFFYDPDIGGASDDLTGCDSINQTFFSYNGDNDDYQYGSYPPALGFRLIHGPVVPSVGDSAWYFGEITEGFKALPLASYVAYPNGDDPQSATESYNLLQGFNRNGTPLANGTTFDYPGDPVIGTGDLDQNPGNPHGVGACGPFTFEPGDSQSVLLKIGVGQGNNRLASVANLRAILTSSDSIIDNRDKTLPRNFELFQNYPNPFNGNTIIRYDIVLRSFVTIEIFNILGQRVRTLVSRYHSRGRYRADWDGADTHGRQLASGVYYYCLRAGENIAVEKMVLLK